eukprot:3698989-Rhodomonas_salina.2
MSRREVPHSSVPDQVPRRQDGPVEGADHYEVGAFASPPSPKPRRGPRSARSPGRKQLRSPRVTQCICESGSRRGLAASRTERMPFPCGCQPARPLAEFPVLID